MKAIQIFLITSLMLLSALAGGCDKDDGRRPPWEIPDSMLVTPEPDPDPMDTVYVSRFSGLWHRELYALNNNLECLKAKFVWRDDSLYDEKAKGNIVGTWKLLLYDNGSSRPIELLEGYTDCSCRSVIYTFNADSTVTIASDTSVIQSGTFKYSYTFSPRLSPLLIGDEEYECQTADPFLSFCRVHYAVSDYLTYDAGGGVFFKINQ